MIKRLKAISTGMVLAGAILVSGCQTAPDGSRQIDVNKANNYLTGLSIGVSVAKASFNVIYGGMAPCSDTKQPPLCKDPTIQAEVNKAIDAFNLALAGARKTVTTLSSSQADIDKAVQAVTDAVDVLAQILAKYGILVQG